MFYLNLLAELEDVPPIPSKGQGTFLTEARRFYGFLGCYLFCLYGKRTATLAQLRVTELEEAEGDDEKGYLINVSSRIL